MKRYIRSDSAVLPEGSFPRDKDAWTQVLLDGEPAWEFECSGYVVDIKPNGNMFSWDMGKDGKYLYSGGFCKTFAIASEMAEKAVRSNLRDSVRQTLGW